MITKESRISKMSEQRRQYFASAHNLEALLDWRKVTRFCGDRKTHKIMMEMAEQGNLSAQRSVTYGYTHGEYGLEKNFEKLIQIAQKGWVPAIDSLLGIYSLGLYGIKPSRRKYLNLVNKFIYIPSVCDRYCYDLKYGSPAIPKNHDILKILADRNDLMGDYAKLYLGYPT